MPTDMIVPCGEGLINLRVGAILLRDGKFLMASNRRDPYLYTVGGRVQFGETAEQAVVREVEEETGWKLKVDRLGFVHENYFIMDIGPHRGRPVYELDFYFYMEVPLGFEPVVQSHTSDGLMERMEWVAPDDPRTIYPDFFREELKHPELTVKHFVTDERE
ncbi:MAG: NUDIX domain-containing protein [Clostridia bacterium]|nr:NUDIX domain-containing protein [Clostridia bacterium]